MSIFSGLLQLQNSKVSQTWLFSKHAYMIEYSVEGQLVEHLNVEIKAKWLPVDGFRLGT